MGAALFIFVVRRCWERKSTSAPNTPLEPRLIPIPIPIRCQHPKSQCGHRITVSRRCLFQSSGSEPTHKRVTISCTIFDLFDFLTKTTTFIVYLLFFKTIFKSTFINYHYHISLINYQYQHINLQRVHCRSLLLFQILFYIFHHFRFYVSSNKCSKNEIQKGA